MELQSMIIALISIIVGALGWFMARLTTTIDELEKNINNCQNNLPLNYVLKEDYRRDISEIKDTLEKIYNKIDKKK